MSEAFLRRNYPDSYLEQIGAQNTNGFLVAKQYGSTRSLIRARSISTTYRFPQLIQKNCSIKVPKKSSSGEWGFSQESVTLYSERHELNIRVAYPYSLPVDGEEHSLTIRNWTHIKDRSQPVLYGWRREFFNHFTIVNYDEAPVEVTLGSRDVGGNHNYHIQLFMPSLGTNYEDIIQPEMRIDARGVGHNDYLTANAQPGKWLLFLRLQYKVGPTEDSYGEQNAWVAFWINSTEATHTPDNLEFKFFDRAAVCGTCPYDPTIDYDDDEKNAIIHSVKSILSGESIRIEPMYPES